MLKYSRLCLIVLVLILLNKPPVLSGEDIIAGGEKGPYRRLFLDPLTIEKQTGLDRIFHSAEKSSGNPVLKGDKPWETEGAAGPYLYGTVLRDKGKFRMWYHFINKGYKNGYAESEDGIHWNKPNLGIVEFNGSKDNNIFLGVTQDPEENPPRKERGQCHNASVIKRTWIEDDDKRYILFCHGEDYQEVRAAFSSDGLHWDFVPETAENGLFESSDVVNFFYDPYETRYVSTWKGATRRGRSVGIAFSDDGLNWRKPLDRPVFTADDLDPPATQIYGMPVFAYQGIYIGMPWIYHAKPHYPPEMYMSREEAESESPCTMDVQLAWSHDLINWTRPPERKAFIPRGSEGDFDSEMIFTARKPVVVDDKLYLYYGGFDVAHNKISGGRGAIGLATLRLDGFCSMRAGDDAGNLITKREMMKKPKIVINAKTGEGGFVKAEIRDPENNVIPGFSVEDCVPFEGDEVEHILRWKSEKFPENQQNSLKKIRFYLKNADIYSYSP